MSDEPTGEPAPSELTGGSATESGSSSDSAAGPDVDVSSVVAYLQWGGLIALAILAVVAGVGLYTSLSAVIEVWIADYYQPFARAAFNFAVLCVAVAGIFVLLRRV